MRSLFVLLYLVAFVYSSNNVCLDESYAIAATDALKAFNPAKYVGITTSAQVVSVFQDLMTAYSSVTSAWFYGFYFALPSGDFYILGHCESMPPGTCRNTYNGLVFGFRNTAQNTNLRMFEVGSDNSIDLTAEPTYSAPYNTTSRPWYGKAGWVQYTYVIGVNAYTYVSSQGSAVVAADRTNMEPCGSCLSNSNCVSIASALASSNLQNLLEAKDAKSVSTAMRTLYQLVVPTLDAGYLSAFYVGLSNGDWYGVAVCGMDISDTACAKAGKTDGYVGTMRNVAVYGDAKRRAVLLDSFGAVSSVIGTTETTDYPTTQRPWYLFADGWTEPYSYAGSSKIGRTFAASFNGGVAGVDYDSDEPCPHPESGAKGMTPFVLMSIMVVLFMVLFM